MVGPDIDHIRGVDLVHAVSKIAADRSYRIYFYGSEPGVGQRMADALKAQYPGLQIAGVHTPPFRTLTPLPR